MRHALPLVVSLLLSSGALVSQGSIVSYRATGVFTSSSFPSDIAVGDQFIIDFSYDDSVFDSNTNSAGNFFGALRDLSFSLMQGFSTGQYSGGRLTIPGEIETIDGTSFVPDRFYARVDDGTFPSLGGHPFGSLLLVLDDPSHRTSIIDPGGHPTLASVLNGELVLSQFSDTVVRISPIGKNGMAEGVVSTLTTVPEATSVPLIAVGALSLSRRRSFLRRSSINTRDEVA